jgi:hypothetical protein
MPLRRWMMNAMAFHCRGAIRDRDRSAGRRAEIEDLDSVAAAANDASRAFDRAWAVALAGEAFGIAQADADSRGRPDDATVFRMHAVDGLTHRQIAQQLGITEAQSAHAAKRVSDRMRQAVRDLLREEGVPAAGLEAAVAEVLALVEESSDGWTDRRPTRSCGGGGRRTVRKRRGPRAGAACPEPARSLRPCWRRRWPRVSRWTRNSRRNHCMMPPATD